MPAQKATILEPYKSPADSFARDEMNLAEFPLTLMTDTAKSGLKTIYFEDSHGRLTITGSDAYGLPTPNDADVLIALQALTKMRNNFSCAKVEFTKYELLKILGWKNRGDSYQRIDESFNRWGGVWLVYDKCWYDNRRKRYVSAKMHIIESVEFFSPDNADPEESRKSSFTWNQKFIESCQADYLRAFDLDVYRNLKNALAKRLYRFLGKRFYKQADWTFDLKDLAFEHVGLNRGYRDAGKIKEKLAPALKKLEAIGFLEPLEPAERYHKIDRGNWTIRVGRKIVQPSPLPLFDHVEKPVVPLASELVKRGITESVAVALVADHPSEVVHQQIEQLDFLVARNDRKVSKSPSGYLVKSIQGGYAAPHGFVSRADQEKRQAEKAAAIRKEQTERTTKAQAKAKAESEETAARAQLAAMTPEERQATQDAALNAAGEGARATIENLRRHGLGKGDGFLEMLTLSYLKEQAHAEASKEPA